MSTPPRRRRSVTPPPPSGGGGGWIGTAAIALGVAVAGLGIGVLLAAWQQRAKTPDTRIAQATQAPAFTAAPAASRAPVAIATIVPPHTARPTPSPAPSLSPGAKPSASPSVAPTMTPKPSPSPKATALATHAPTPSPTPARVTPAPSLRSAPPAPPVLTQSTVTRAPLSSTPVPTRVPLPPTAAPTVALPVQTPPTSAMALAAQGTVRRYIEALARGDETAGYALLGGSDRGQQLSEESFLDPSARITSIRSKRIDDSNATVEADITSAKGSYSVNYHVTATPHGPIITQHDFIKV